MKLLYFTILSLISFSTSAVEFHSCTDSKGKKHFTNLPKSSLNANCETKDHYALLLDQDYLNLSTEYEKYEISIEEGVKDSKPFDLREVDLSVDTVKSKFQDILNPDKALDELMTTTEERDDIFTRAMRGRSQGIQNIIDQDKAKLP